MRYFIDNKLAFLGAVLAFLGSLFVSLDRFNYFHEQFSNVGEWKRINCALRQLEEMKAQSSDKQPLGVLTGQDEGFSELAKIISLNRLDLAGKRIVAIARNKPVGIAELDIAVIHVLTDDSPRKGTPVCFEFALNQWISAYRTEWFLYRGFILVTLGFLLGVISRIKREKTETPPDVAPESPPSNVGSPVGPASVAPSEKEPDSGVSEEPQSNTS